MPKRTNEESQSEPAAKRVANSSSHEDLLVEAQASLDRLDFKTTETICSQIIDSNPKDVHYPLMIRSIGLGKANRPYEAVQDVERALNSKKSVETHLRAAFAYLGMVQHHLNLAKGHFTEGQDPTTSLPSRNVIELEESIQDAKALDKRGSFERVSPELFVKIVGFCDSPSLIRCTRVSKQFNQSIFGNEELFRSFTMRGSSSQILRGLMAFTSRCNDSLRFVKLEVLDGFNYFVKARLEMILSNSTLTLRSIEVAHQGELGYMLVSIAECCPSLKVFSTSRLDSRTKPHRPALIFGVVTFSFDPSKWLAGFLETFIVTCESVKLQCDDNLLTVLQRAKVVKITDSGVGQDWIIKLLSSIPSLIEVEFPLQKDLSAEDEPIEMPDFNLPSLISLSLARVPLDSFRESEGTFFEKLDAPFLQELWLGKIDDPAQLGALESHLLRSLRVGVQGCSSHQPSAERSAYELLYAIANLENLRSVDIQIDGTHSSRFCKEFLQLLTPKSHRAIQNSWKNKLLLPRLNSLTIGSDLEQGDKSKQVSVAVMDLTCLVACRIAINRKVSSTDVLSSMTGDFEASEAPVSSNNVNFPDSVVQVCSIIESLDVKNSRVDAGYDHYENPTAASAWLSENVSNFKPSSFGR